MIRLCALLALLVVGGAIAAPVPKALKAKRPKIDGSWRLVELNLSGTDYTNLNPQEWQIEDGNVTMIRTAGGNTKPVTDCGPFRLTPATGGGEAMDWVSDENRPPTTSPSLARVTGDEFVLVIGHPEHPRPTEFKSDQWTTLYRFERITAK